ncbi:target of Myb protein 1 [Gallus gallus]|uniref:Target of Myb1 membrane trafficking protein n=1 Tax=Gallus gallus TaxID=9031 RepID=TOM1_CHICK|nr:target of Myb1 membrane trafficking protein [Gallus gallus]O12940.2 RecName: Full=Target of Myb1 membrane trafficking protein; AltName: Full=Target of Myb protein 1; Short=Tom-1 [Gallus gallus]CAA69996.1 tom-1B protein [Gallus gallus]|eukprot:NP_990475.1 target of Myb protein 1 [Gallus gallus]
MDFLLGNPFSSPVGQRIERATDGSLRGEDWSLNMEICDIINETEEGPKDAFRAIKKRIVGNKNFHEVMLALTVLETCVKNCGHRFHILVASQDFVESVLVRTILPKNNPPAIVHDKVLTLIQSWADAFRSSPDLTGVVAVYEDLRRKGLEFPMTDLDMLSPIHTPRRSVYSSNSQSGQNSPAVNSPQQMESILHPVTLPSGRDTSSNVPITPTQEQIKKLRSELEVVNGNVKVMSEMLTELVPSQAETSDLELLQELNRTCRAMQQRVLELIPRVQHEQLTEELLLINDNLNNVFLRHERFERVRTGQPVKAPSEAENNLIDLRPSTPPAVRQPEVTNNLSSQLAGMTLGSRSVSAGLHSLDTSGKLEEEFDMFAVTRGSSLAEQRREVKYEDPQATKGLAGALDARQQNTGAEESSASSDGAQLTNWMMRQGMVPVPQANFMEDIEKWLSTDVGESEDGKGVTSEEFDKFLEERAKVADRLPTLSSSSAGTPVSPAAASRHQKQAKEDDAMFAL